MLYLNNIKKVTNFQKANQYKEKYNDWKNESLNQQGYFIVFDTFVKNNILKRISGNALRLYIFLGSYSDNYTGECWVTIDTMAKYFDRTPRTISYWIRDLEDHNLIKRFQLKPNSPSHTYLQPYSFE